MIVMLARYTNSLVRVSRRVRTFDKHADFQSCHSQTIGFRDAEFSTKFLFRNFVFPSQYLYSIGLPVYLRFGDNNLRFVFHSQGTLLAYVPIAYWIPLKQLFTSVCLSKQLGSQTTKKYR